MIADLLMDIAAFFDRSNTLHAAYKAAWKHRVATGDDSTDRLILEMKERSVPGAYDDADSPRISPALRAWTQGIDPLKARQTIQRAPTRRPRS